MENELEKMKKSTPYTVPEGFFDEMEKRFMQEVATEKKKPTVRKVALWTSLTVAASLALLLVLHQRLAKTEESSFEQVEMAFNQLSDADQQLLLEYFDEMYYLDN